MSTPLSRPGDVVPGRLARLLAGATDIGAHPSRSRESGAGNAHHCPHSVRTVSGQCQDSGTISPFDGALMPRSAFHWEKSSWPGLDDEPVKRTSSNEAFET